MIEDLIGERRKKLARLKETGIDPYPARALRKHTVAEALAIFLKEPQGGPEVSIAGRLMNFRDQGGVMFWDIRDESGEMQAVLKQDDLKEFDLWKGAVDQGDFIAVSGPIFITNRGQKSVAVKTVQLLTKSLRPLPSERFGIEDEELRLRKRYVELAINPELRDLFKRKAAFWQAFRDTLNKEGFLEVETGVLEAVPGGAEAEPFKTHHNALDTDFFLRISLELPLKRLLVGGYDAVFEIGRIFRNEGIDREHLQDYTQLEFYWAYHDVKDLMRFVEKLYKRVVQKTTGGLTTKYAGQAIEWGGKWPKVDYLKAFKKETGLDPSKASLEKLSEKAKELGLEFDSKEGRGRLVDLIYKKTVRPTLVQPCFLVNHPKLISPLAKSSPKNPAITERLQVLACGTELGNGWSELNDPDDQRARFEEQMKLREAGDAEAMRLDEDFLEALEYGMPPAAGFGVSERLFSILMDKPVRETVIFPLMRPKSER